MKVQGEISIGGKTYKKGDEVHWLSVYPFFFVHMGFFGLFGFVMAYAEKGPPTFFLYVHGGFAILIYIVFYKTIFGKDSIKWMFINAGLGLFGIFVEINWILSFFGTQVYDYPLHVHVIPFMYYVLYTFLLRQAYLDFSNSRDGEYKQQRAERKYIIFSMVIYGIFYLL